MKKLLLPFLLFLGFTLVNGVAFGQVPVTNYNGTTGATTFSVAANSAITPILPNTTNTVGTYGAVNAIWAKTTNTGSQSGGITYDSFLGVLYGTEYAYGQLDKIVLGTTGTVSVVNYSAFPTTTGYSVVTDAAGTVYVSNNSSKTVLEFATGSTSLTRTITGFTATRGLAIDAANNLYVVDAVTPGTNGTGKIYKFAQGATSTAAAITTYTGLSNPFGIAITGNDIYLTQYGTTAATQGIFKITNGVTGSTTVSSFYTVASTFLNPRNLAFDGNGNLFVADYGNGKIERITPGTTPVLTSPITLATVNGVTFDPAGNLYVGDLSNYFKKYIGTYYTYTGTLPTGLTLNPVTGVISGTPTAAGMNPVTVTATNAAGASTGQALTFNLTYPPATVSYASTTPPPPYTFTVGTALPNTIIPTSTNVRTTPTPAFAISPTLPGGLTFTATNGQITGNPTTVSPDQTYTVTVYNNGGVATMTTFNIQVVAPPPPTVSYTGTTPPGPNYTFTQGTTLPATIVPTSTNVKASAGFAISPAIPAGLNFSTTNGAITGSPSTPQASTAYVVTVTGPSGLTATTNLSILIYITAPAISYTPSSYTFPSGVASSTAAPNSTGGAVATYSISSSTPLPPYVSINSSTGVISSTAQVAPGTGTYNVIATNGNPSTATTPITITFVQKPNISYSPPASFTLNTAIAPLNPSNSGGSVAAVGFNTGTLTTTGLSGPWGMTFDASGNLYEVNNTSGTILKYTGGTGTGGSFITGLTSPTGIVYDGSTYFYVSDEGGDVFRFNNGGTGKTTIVTGGGGTATSPSSIYGIAIDATGNLYLADYQGGNIYKYVVSSSTISELVALGGAYGPAGLAIDNAGNIYDLDEYKSKLYKYDSNGNLLSTILTGLSSPYGLAIDGGGDLYVGDSGTGTVTIYNNGGTSLGALSGSGLDDPRGIVLDSKGDVFVSSDASGTIYKFVPAGGYYLATPLPPGLTFSTASGQLAGTPATVFSNVSVTVTAYNAGGPGSTTFTINCTSPPVITYVTPDTYTVNVAITPLTPTNTGSTPVTGYTVSPSLPAGLSISSSTGVISGTPTAATAAANYTVTATNAYGTGTFAININVGTPPVITYPGNTYNAPINAAITITPNNTGSPVSNALAYGAGTALTPTGLSGPYGMTYDASGNLYVTNYTAGTVVKYTNGTGTATSFITGLTNPTGIVYDGTTYFYVSTIAGYVYRYTNTGGTQTTIVTGGGGTAAKPASIYGLDIDAAGDLFMADPSTKCIYKYTAGGTTAKLITTGSGSNSNYLVQPTGVQVDGAGNIYTLDFQTNLIAKWTAAGAYTSTIVPAGTLTNAYGLYQDAAGNFFVADPTGSKVNVYSSAGALITTVNVGSNPRGVVTDASGNLFVSDETANTVTKYPKAYGYVLTSGTLPTGLTFTATTGVVSGTPAAATSGTTYNLTVTAYNQYGTSNVAPLIIKCYTSYDWTGATSAFAAATNWESQLTPPTTAVISIGVNYPFAVAPIVTANTTVAGVLLGDKGGRAAGVSVSANKTLTITGDITKQSDPTATTIYTSGFTGNGTISAANLNIIANTAFTAPYAMTVSSAINNLVLSGNVNLTSGFSTYAENATFNLLAGDTTAVAGLLKTTNTTGSTSTISVTNSDLQLSNAAALSSLSANGTNVLSFVNTGATIEYSGAAQTVYTDAAITGLTTGPSYQNIIFSGTGVKTPNGTATSNLNVAGDFTNAMANDGVNYPLLTNTYIQFNGNGAQSLNGGAGPTIAAGSPTITAPSPTGTVFNNVYFSNTGSNPSTKTIATGGFSVASTGILTMVGTGSYNVLAVNGGSLTLNSTANSSASVAPIATGGPSITGNVNVQRFVTGGSGYRGYRLMSSPVHVLGAPSNAYLINYPIGSSFLKGDVAAGVGTGGFDALGNPNLYLYRDDITPSNATFTSGNYRGVNMINNSPAYVYSFDGETSNYDTYPGQGFLFFFRGDRYATGQSLTTESVTTYVPTNTIITSTGVLNQQSVAAKWWHDPTKSLDFTAAPNNSATIGFNLVGNPYASTIDLNTASTAAGAGIQLSSISTTTPLVVGVETNFYELNTNAPYAQQFAIYDVANPALSTNNATRYIASGQGFFAKTDAAGQTLTFNETAKVTTAASQPQSQSTLFMAEEHGRNSMIHRTTGSTDANLKYLRLTLAMDSTSAEDAVVAFKEKSSADFVINEDALYRQGTGKVSLSSMSADNQTLAINMLPLVKKGTTIIPLNVGALADGTYSFNMTEFNNIPATDEVWLKDAKLSDSTSMKIGASYSFAIALADTTTYGSKRFTLVIREDPKKTVHLLNFIANKVINGAKVIWKTDNEQNYTNFVVQRSIDNGKTFDDLNAFVSNAEGSYSFLDTHPVMPADNYRLKITDLSGNISYSNIAPLQYSDLSNKISTNAITVYPNPAVGSINIAISQNFTSASFGVQIVSSSGVVMKKETSGTANWQSDVSRFLPGTYIIQVINNADKTVVGKGTFVKL